MPPEPYLAEIFIYPVKSLGPVRRRSARITPGGSLEYDRRWAMLDAAGRLINAKRTADVAHYRYEWDGVSAPVVTPAVTLIEDADRGFPDDEDSPGPTLVSRASLEEMASWFDGLTADAMRERLRPNLVIDGVPAFWEDRWFAASGRVPFEIGGVRFEGVNPCQRCVVPSRDPATGEAIPGFQKRFAEMRERTLPAWSARERFNHFYRATLNTVVPASESGKVLTAAASEASSAKLGKA